MISRSPPSTLSPYTTLFRSLAHVEQPGIRVVGGRLPVDRAACRRGDQGTADRRILVVVPFDRPVGAQAEDRKSTRLNSSHLVISYAVFCLKKKKNNAYSIVV